jgi:hypothetical protein
MENKKQDADRTNHLTIIGIAIAVAKFLLDVLDFIFKFR